MKNKKLKVKTNNSLEILNEIKNSKLDINEQINLLRNDIALIKSLPTIAKEKK